MYGQPPKSRLGAGEDVGSTGIAWEAAIPVDGRQGSSSGGVAGGAVHAVIGARHRRSEPDQPVAEADADL